jgi:16S rRNA (guanine527-N7)-methyltransferase
MFNVKHWIEAVVNWLGVSLKSGDEELLSRYASWLIEEAIPAGGLGPGEASRVLERHVADSLAFSAGLSSAPSVVLDLGSGVGLPGIPLAILRPETEFVLVDRSGRRTDLAARAVRILGIENVRTHMASFEAWDAPCDGIVSRAALPLDSAYPLVRRLLKADGAAVLGLSRTDRPLDSDELGRAATHHRLAVDIIDVPVLDSPTRLLRIVHSDHKP